MSSLEFMPHAIALAREAFARDEVPVGAIVVHEGKIIATACNAVEARLDVTAHAEIMALRQAAAHLGDVRLPECELYVTLEPCAMCAAAISFARIRKIVFGAYDPKGGGIEHGARFFQQTTCHHAPEVIGGVMEAECGTLLREFFEKKR